MKQALALVIDDEPDICELLTLTLGRMDILTMTAADVSSAKALLGANQFDLCLTDMRLPDGDGLELVEWMQSHAAGPICGGTQRFSRYGIQPAKSAWVKGGRPSWTHRGWPIGLVWPVSG